METKILITKILRLPDEWEIADVIIQEDRNEIQIHIRYTHSEGVCKQTGELCPLYDFRPERSWRHLDLLGYQCYLVCRVPRIKNSLGNVLSVPIPWADEDNRHTKDFENYAIRLLKATHNQTKAGELLGVSYEKMNHIMMSSVARGLKKRDLAHDEIPTINMDEKSYRKGHHYATIISDSIGNRVLEVGQERTQSATEALLETTFTKEQLENMQAVCVDMWDAFMAAVKKSARRLKLCTINFM